MERRRRHFREPSDYADSQPITFGDSLARSVSAQSNRSSVESVPSSGASPLKEELGTFGRPTSSAHRRSNSGVAAISENEVDVSPSRARRRVRSESKSKKQQHSRKEWVPLAVLGAATALIWLGLLLSAYGIHAVEESVDDATPELKFFDKSSKATCESEGIDVVFLYSNSSKISTGRDLSTLRYALRSLEVFSSGKFHDLVVLSSSDESPTWLKSTNAANYYRPVISGTVRVVTSVSRPFEPSLYKRLGVSDCFVLVDENTILTSNLEVFDFDGRPFVLHNKRRAPLSPRDGNNGIDFKAASSLRACLGIQRENEIFVSPRGFHLYSQKFISQMLVSCGLSESTLASSLATFHDNYAFLKHDAPRRYSKVEIIPLSQIGSLTGSDGTGGLVRIVDDDPSDFTATVKAFEIALKSKFPKKSVFEV